MNLSRRASEIQPSATLEISSRAKELKKAGEDILSFGAGEPDFPTPAPAAQAGQGAIADGHTGYTAVPGILELRTAIAEAMTATRGVAATPSEIVVSAGVKHGIYLALLSTLDPGDEVLGLSPYWVSYPWMCQMAGLKYVPIDSMAGCRPDLAAIRAAVSERTRALLINSPNNPSGVVYTEDEMCGLMEIAREYDLWVISDEIYKDLVFGAARFISPLHVAPDDRDRILALSGFSKSYAMPGWRVGFVFASAATAKTISNVQSHLAGNINTPAQYAALEALRSCDGYVAEMAAEFAERRELMADGLARLDGVECPRPDGAFYVFPRVSALFGDRFQDDVEFSLALLDEAKIAVIPGTAFGAPGHIRFSYATSRANIAAGLERFEAFIARL